MTLQCKVGNFLTGTGAVASTVAVTGVGFTPKFIIFYWSGRTEAIDTVSSQTHKRGMGFVTSATDRRCWTTLSVDANAGASAGSRLTEAECIVVLNTAAAVDGALDLTSMDSDGFTLDVTDQFATSYRIHYMAWGGSDITNVTCGTMTAPLALGTQDTIVTGSFQPALVLWMGGNTTSAAPITVADSTMLFGAATGSSAMGVWAGGSNDGAATTDTNAYCKSGECIAHFASNVASIVARAAFVQFNADGFRLNWTEVSGNAHRLFYLAVAGGRWHVGNLLTQTDIVTPIVETGFGFQPAGALFLSACRAESTADTPTANDQWTAGAFSDASTRGAHGILDEDNLATSDTNSAVEFDEVYANISAAAAIQGLMDISSVDTDGFTCIMDDADPSQSFVFYISGGNVVTPSTAITTAQQGASNAQFLGAGASETLYYLIINSPTGQRLAIIQDYAALECARVVNSVGALTFSVSADRYSLDSFPVDGLVELWRLGRGALERLEFQQLWFIRERTKTISGNVRMWRITCYDLNYLLSNPNGDAGRIVAYAVDFSSSASSTTASKTDKTGAADDLLKQVARENMATAVTDTTRNLTQFFFSVEADKTAAAVVRSQMARRNLLKLFQELCDASTTAGTYLAWDIICTSPPSSGGAIAFALRSYTLQRGVDHRASSNNPLLFGPDFGNMDDIELAFINTDEANFIYAAGKGEEGVRLNTTASDTARINASPYNRREQFLDASNADGPASLQDAADAALRAGRPLLTLAGRLVDTDQARYGVHWEFGDYVTAQVDGYSFDCRLDAISIAFNQDNGEVITIKVKSESGVQV